MENQAQLSGVSFFNWRNDVEWLLLDFLRETKHTELNRVESKPASVLVTPKWCNEIGGSCLQITLLPRCERQRDGTRDHVFH